LIHPAKHNKVGLSLFDTVRERAKLGLAVGYVLRRHDVDSRGFSRRLKGCHRIPTETVPSSTANADLTFSVSAA
jgi:hypothetical protein